MEGDGGSRCSGCRCSAASKDATDRTNRSCKACGLLSKEGIRAQSPARACRRSGAQAEPDKHTLCADTVKQEVGPDTVWFKTYT
eukprot:205430-Chlamydomonas_euryale.AAC.2